MMVFRSDPSVTDALRYLSTFTVHWPFQAILSDHSSAWQQRLGGNAFSKRLNGRETTRVAARGHAPALPTHPTCLSSHHPFHWQSVLLLTLDSDTYLHCSTISTQFFFAILL